MSYLVLARKYRPQGFEDLLGQEHVAEILKRAISSDRVAHAYLFCGPRGVGKTSCARIMAKCLNAEGGPNVKPDESSFLSKEIANGTSFDVLEIDGASNRGIDEIRALRENVKFAPSYGRYKIYIVDEVHMLTTEAFNALLKTLEEPPAHVKFIFATTAPNKLPATIISRCQRFDFKRIPIKIIIEQIAKISKSEKLKIDDDAAYVVAKAAQGSMRDALSILDQLGAVSDKSIAAGDVYSMLGLVEIQWLFDLAGALGEKKCAAALEIFENIINQGKDVKQLAQDLTEHFRNLMVIKVGGKSLGKLVDYPANLKSELLTQCDLFTLKDIVVAIETLIKAQEIARIVESARMPLEVAFAKLTYTGESQPAAEPAVKRENTSRPKTAPQATVTAPRRDSAAPKILNSKKGEVDLSRPQEPDEQEAAQPAAEEVSGEDSPVVTVEKIIEAWDALTYAVSREKMSLATYLQDGHPVSFATEKLVIGFPKECAFQKEHLESAANIKVVESVFGRQLKVPVIIKYQLMDAAVGKTEDPSIQSALETFNGKVINRWHND